MELLAPGMQGKTQTRKRRKEREVENVLKAKMPLAYVA